MVTYREFHASGHIAAFSDALWQWTFRVYEDETLTASITPVTAPPGRDMIATNTPRLVLFNGQAAQSTPESPFILRFQLVQYTETLAQSWTISCKARLDPASSSVVRGTWSHVMATPDWPRPNTEMEHSNYDFQLDQTVTSIAPRVGDVRSLSPLSIGRYAFQGVLVDEDTQFSHFVVVELMARDGDRLDGILSFDDETRRPLLGTWASDGCSWKDSFGLFMNAQVDTLLLIGEWSHNRGSCGWFELVMMSAKWQWRKEDHTETPASLQQAFTCCLQLGLPGVDADIWDEIFSFCDYDWFEG